MKKLVIAEKPDAGRKMARVIEPTAQNHKGYLEGPNWIITWAIGHLVELAEPDHYGFGWQTPLAQLPFIPGQFDYKPSKGKEEQLAIICQLLKRNDVNLVVEACDAGREGAAISHLIVQASGVTKPTKRLWISSLTDEAIQAGFDNLHPIEEFEGLKQAAILRQQADWLIGMNGTIAQTRMLQMVGAKGVFPVGRVQTPTLALVYQRDQAIAVFVPQKFWEVVAEFKVAAGTYAGSWFKGETRRFDKLEEAQKIVTAVTDQTGVVTSLTSKVANEHPPLLFDLTTLQRTANVRFAFSAAKTLEIAQSLYSKGLITYPRTDSRFLTDDLNKQIGRHVKAVAQSPWEPFTKGLEGKTLSKRFVNNGKVTDHHAIIPTTSTANVSTLAEAEKTIYDVIVRRFLAAFFPAARYEVTKVLTTVKGETFASEGKVLLELGWKAVERPDKSEEDLPTLPIITQGESATVIKSRAVEKMTKAPARYTQASMLADMETAGKGIDDETMREAMKERGLGTPATRASIIEGLLKREYLVEEGKTIRATAKAATLLTSLSFDLLKSPELTGGWEFKLKQIEKGSLPPETFIAEINAMAVEMTKAMTASKPQVNREGKAEKTYQCPQCPSHIEFFEGKDKRKWVKCQSADCGYFTSGVLGKKSLKLISETRCPKCSKAIKVAVGQNKPFIVCSDRDCEGKFWIQEDGKLQAANAPKTNREAGPACEKCQTVTAKRGPFTNGSFAWGCPKYKDCGAGLIWIEEKAAQ